MSKKDGKATLLRATEKKSIHILPLHPSIESLTIEVAKACPVKIIKIV
jgi:ferredoxin